jgi:ketosteroid isomerase-like protein
MSQENLETANAAYAAWNAGDMDALRRIYDPDVVSRSVEGWPESGPFFGRDEVMREWKRMREAFNLDAIELLSVTNVGDRVLARLVWRGGGSGPAAEFEVTQVSTFRKGRCIAIEHFWDHAEALEAAGLSEQDAQTDAS